MFNKKLKRQIELQKQQIEDRDTFIHKQSKNSSELYRENKELIDLIRKIRKILLKNGLFASDKLDKIKELVKDYHTNN